MTKQIENYLVYVAGPYTAKDPTGDAGRDYMKVNRNIELARLESLKVLRHGIGYPVCPHLNTAHFEIPLPDVPIEYWYAATMELLTRCDAIWMVPGWEESKGARNELRTAIAENLDVWIGGEKQPESEMDAILEKIKKLEGGK